ncbi:MAG TPA: hypothetical protein VJ734_05560 [Nitrosospira sp.]|nr:hypothetical protein [Nitrosospira sp.]
MSWLHRDESFSMILRKALLLILVSALTFLPILQGAHALTHVDDAETAGAIYADEHEESGEIDAEAAIDANRVCLDCLALSGLTIIFMALVVLSSNQRRCQLLPSLKSGLIPLDFSLPYLVRGPPQV